MRSTGTSITDGLKVKGRGWRGEIVDWMYTECRPHLSSATSTVERAAHEPKTAQTVARAVVAAAPIDLRSRELLVEEDDCEEDKE